MKITILTLGSRGDIQPYVALGAGLQATGHQVSIASHVPFGEFIQSKGLDFVPTAGNPMDAIQGEMGRNWLESSQNPLTFVQRMFAVARPMMDEILDAYTLACANAELIIHPVLASMAATSLGEKLGIPVCAAYLQHVHRSTVYPWSLSRPKPELAPWPYLEKAYNWSSHWIAEQVFWQFIRPIINTWRREKLTLPPFPLRSEFSAWVERRSLCLYGISPTVMPKPAEWGPEVHLTGYWFLKRDSNWQPPADLADFLASGKPPVYIGFGSMSNRNPEAVADMALSALTESGQRGILLTGWGGIQNRDLPDHVLKIESAPHDWLFPQMAAVVHHGGCGTTAAGLAAGVPSIVVPYFADQPFWGWRVQMLEAGPAPIPRKKLSAERLTRAIQKATADLAMQERARQLGQLIRSECGIEQAITIIDQNF